ncbi:hypothetical protein KC872_03115 [Candidatus Kaiserbacteria bacterium]|nr:hypothetical protein [Candidatus Kaiserbacteria bacterium]
MSAVPSNGEEERPVELSVDTDGSRMEVVSQESSNYLSDFKVIISFASDPDGINNIVRGSNPDKVQESFGMGIGELVKLLKTAFDYTSEEGEDARRQIAEDLPAVATVFGHKIKEFSGEKAVSEFEINVDSTNTVEPTSVEQVESVNGVDFEKAGKYSFNTEPSSSHVTVGEFDLEYGNRTYNLRSDFYFINSSKGLSGLVTDGENQDRVLRAVETAHFARENGYSSVVAGMQEGLSILKDDQGVESLVNSKGDQICSTERLGRELGGTWMIGRKNGVGLASGPYDKLRIINPETGSYSSVEFKNLVEVVGQTAVVEYGNESFGLYDVVKDRELFADQYPNHQNIGNYAKESNLWIVGTPEDKFMIVDTTTGDVVGEYDTVGSYRDDSGFAIAEKNGQNVKLDVSGKLLLT